MSVRDEEKPETGTETEATPTVKQRRGPPPSGARSLGSLCGAAVALPTMAVAFVVAMLAGVPGETAVSRGLVAALVMWTFVALSVRLVFGTLLEDWKKARRERRRREVSG